MAFETINSSEIDVGKPLKKDLFRKIKTSLDDLDSRVSNLSLAGGTFQLFSDSVMMPKYYAGSEYIISFRAHANLSITEIKLQLMRGTSSSGSLILDVLKGSNVSSLLSVLTTNITLDTATATTSTVISAAINSLNQSVTSGQLVVVKLLNKPTESVMFNISINGGA